MKPLAVLIIIVLTSFIASAADPTPNNDWIGKTVLIKPSKEGSFCIRIEKYTPIVGRFDKAAADDCSFKVMEGSAPGTVSFQSVTEPALFIHHSNYHLLKGIDDSSMFRIVPPIRGNQGVSFQSYNFPTHHITLVDREHLDIVKDSKEARKSVFYLEERK
jgi:hypothetical protein